MLDPIDLRILAVLQQNARTTNADLARELEMAPSAMLERVRKLEHRGILTGYEARLAPRAIGLGLTAFVFVRANEPAGASGVGAAIAAFPEVQEVHNVAGEDCYLVKLRARDTDDLARILRERFKGLPSLQSTRTTIVLSTLKESAQLPLGHLTEGES
jgi:Lrp/AsnC family leucine-responsive transcriptional regulator